MPLPPEFYPPVPSYFYFCWLCLPGVILSGYKLSQKLGVRNASLATPAIVLAMLLLPTHLLSLLFGNFYHGAFMASLVVGACSYLAYFASLRGVPSQGIPYLSSPIFFLAIGLSVLTMLPSIFNFDYHDKLVAYTGHLSFIEQLLNGAYPPRNISFPEYPLEYHFGFDTLAAYLAALCDIPSALSLDLLTLGCWIYFITLIWDSSWCRGFETPWRSVLVVAFVGGLHSLFYFSRLDISASNALIGFIPLHKILVSGPLVSTFFQHPWTAGFPLILVLMKWLEQNTRWGIIDYFCFCFIFICLGIINTTALLTLSGSMAFYGLWLMVRSRTRKEGVTLLVIPTISLISASALNSVSTLLTKSVSGSSPFEFASGGVTGLGLSANLTWNLASFGPFILFGLILAFQTGKLKPFFLIQIVAGVLVCNLIRYKLSWDIVKFASTAKFFSAICIAYYLERLSKEKALLSSFFAICLGLSGLLHQLVYILDFKDIRSARAYHKHELYTRISQEEAQAMNWLRAHYRHTDLVLLPPPASKSWATFGGLPQLHSDRLASHHWQVTQEQAQKRIDFFEAPEIDYALSQGVDWVVHDSQESTETYSQFIAKMKQRGILKLKKQFGTIAIYRRVVKNHAPAR